MGRCALGQIYTWHGQGLALGLPEDDAFGWPGWKSNVTIRRCHTVVLDVDINVQMYSIVVWGRATRIGLGPLHWLRLLCCG